MTLQVGLGTSGFGLVLGGLGARIEGPTFVLGLPTSSGDFDSGFGASERVSCRRPDHMGLKPSGLLMLGFTIRDCSGMLIVLYTPKTLFQ